LLGISARRIQYYTDIKLVKPEIENPSGHGARRKYSRRNLVEFLLIQELNSHGFKLEEIRSVFQAIHNQRLYSRLDLNYIFWKNTKKRSIKDVDGKIHITLVVYGMESEEFRVDIRANYPPKLKPTDICGIRIVPIHHIFEKVDEM